MHNLWWLRVTESSVHRIPSLGRVFYGSVVVSFGAVIAWCVGAIDHHLRLRRLKLDHHDVEAERKRNESQSNTAF